MSPILCLSLRLGATLLACWWLSLSCEQLGLTQEPTRPQWDYSPALLRPFWEGDAVEGESVLFIRDEATGEARASVLFPITQLIALRNSVGDVTYQEGTDYVWKPESREIVIPKGSKVPTSVPSDLRRPAGSQKYQLTHRDGDGEIFYGGRLEYAEMQTCVTYRHEPVNWKPVIPAFDPKSLPRSVARLVSREPLTIVVLGDSISAGANASGLFDAPPYQPPYPELVRRQLAERFKSRVELVNLAVGGTSTDWGLSQVEKVVEAKPHLVVLAFGMNDSSGRTPESYGENIGKIVKETQAKLPECEFILVASMLGNRDWITLKHEVFPKYRDELLRLKAPGIAVADLTSVWTRFLEFKKDWDQTGNGVNHPNDFGHRVYAQVITSLVDPRGMPDATPQPIQRVTSGKLEFDEQRLLGHHTYSYACAAADLDGDGRLDLTSSDAEPNANLYLLRNLGQGQFQPSFIQRYAGEADQPIRLERHAIGDLNRDGRLDVVIVDNLKSDLRWFENPGPDAVTRSWPLRRICGTGELTGAYDVSLADLDGDGDLDVAASSWNGQRFDWFENLGEPGRGEQWRRHMLAEKAGETRTIAAVDINRDGRIDLLGSTRNTNQVLWFENPGAANEPASASDPNGRKPWTRHVIDDQTVSPTHGHPVDFDNDGDIDVLMAFGLATPDRDDSHQVAWYENAGPMGRGERWVKHVIDSKFAQGFEAVAGDLDGDDDVDVVATGWGPAGRLCWFENTGDPKTGWKRHVIKEPWSNAVTVIIVDLDQDDRLDIVACAERGANEVRWWRNVSTSE